MANAPDLEFLPGILVGSPALYHQGVTHSLGFALMVSLEIAVVYSLRGSSFSAIFNLCFISYLSHLLLDFFSPEGRLSYGEPLLWALSGNYFISPVSVLLGVITFAWDLHRREYGFIAPLITITLVLCLLSLY